MIETKNSDWDFFIKKADGDKIFSLHQIMQANGIEIVGAEFNPENLVDSLLKIRYPKSDSICYEKFITDLVKDLNIKSSTQNADLKDKENLILLHILSSFAKSLNPQELKIFKIHAGLMHNDKDSVIREMRTKIAISPQFQKRLPALISSVLGTTASAVSFPFLWFAASVVLPLPAFATYRFIRDLAISHRFMATIARKNSASKVLFPTAILIIIRRESYSSFSNSEEAINFLRFYFRISVNEDKERMATTILTELLQSDSEYTNIEAAQSVSQLIGLAEIIPFRIIESLQPFSKEVKNFLCSYLTDKGDRHNVLPVLFPNGFDSEGKKELKKYVSDNDVNTFSDKTKDQRIAELEKEVSELNDTLHRIRHNVAPALGNALHPYKEFLETFYPITKEDAQKAYDRGCRAIAILYRDGGTYGEPERLDLVIPLRKFFSDKSYQVIFNLPEHAFTYINSNDLSIVILQNIKNNILKHAFGPYDESIVSSNERIVCIDLSESSEYWILKIKNNGEPLAENIDIKNIWKDGVTFGKPASSGKGLFYLKKCIEYFGGVADCERLNGDYSFQYIIKFKKADDEV